MARAVVRNDPNYKGAFFAFLRVLAATSAATLLPYMNLLAAGDPEKFPSGLAVIAALGSAFLLTVVNFFRKGETRFGPPPNAEVIEEEEEGR